MTIEYKSLIEHDPDNGKWGDCYRIGIAWLLGLDPKDVPHFYENGVEDPEGGFEAARVFCEDRGYTLVVMPSISTPKELLIAIGYYSPKARYLLTGLSGKHEKTNHVVCCIGSEIAVDPSDSGITGVCTDGYTWIEFLSPIQPTKVDWSQS